MVFFLKFQEKMVMPIFCILMQKPKYHVQKNLFKKLLNTKNDKNKDDNQGRRGRGGVLHPLIILYQSAQSANCSVLLGKWHKIGIQ